jgi:nucleotide-binding universal stress UspA family protein
MEEGAMSTVVAAIDNSAAAGRVLETAGTLARYLGWRVEAVHVREDGAVGARAAAAAASVELTELTGSPTQRLHEVAGRGDVTAFVLGARDFAGVGLFGSTAVELVTGIDKPVVVLPPAAEALHTLRRVLIPLDATNASADALRRGIELLAEAEVEIVILHVGFGESLPMFEDQPQHETDAWMEEFLRCFCPVAPDSVTFELRTGRPGERVLEVAAELEADLIALGWRQDFTAGRAAVVREVLERSPVPVVLFPVPTA